MKNKTQATAVATNDQVKEVAEKSRTADLEAFAGAGMEEATARDFLIPRLTILQLLSPQLQRNKPDYIKGAEAGDVCDVGTGEIFKPNPDDDGTCVVFLPVHFRKDFLEWAPRSSGRGLVAIHQDVSVLDKCTRDTKNKLLLPNGNIIQETAQFFGLNLSANGRRCFLPMASTQLKKARKFMNIASEERLTRADGTKFQAPLFYRTYKLSVTEESNNEGAWFGWRITRGKPIMEIEPYTELLAEVMAFRKDITSGTAKVDVASMATDSGSSDEEETM